jgi:hypothetical protein
LVWCVVHRILWSLYVNGELMTISEYEFFGVSSYANEKDTRFTDSERIRTIKKQEETNTEEERFIDMVRETEVRAAALCTLALLAGLCCALMLGCSTSAKVEGGAEIIELKPLKMQELTYPIHDYSKIC